jgi:hypothetical protein
LRGALPRMYATYTAKPSCWIEAEKLAPILGCLGRVEPVVQPATAQGEAQGASHRRGWPIMGRFFDVLNTPIAVLVLLVVVAGINAFLYFGYRPSEAPASPPADRGGGQRTVESTELRRGPGEATRSASAPRSTSPTRPSAGASAGATASATASARSSP